MLSMVYKQIKSVFKNVNAELTKTEPRTIGASVGIYNNDDNSREFHCG